MDHSHNNVYNFDACKLSTSWAGTENPFLKMSLRNARVSLEYLLRTSPMTLLNWVNCHACRTLLL